MRKYRGAYITGIATLALMAGTGLVTAQQTTTDQGAHGNKGPSDPAVEPGLERQQRRTEIGPSQPRRNRKQGQSGRRTAGRRESQQAHGGKWPREPRRTEEQA
jgi:hypothetical protein